LIIEMSYRSKSGHIGSAFSIVDILTVLYFRVMNISPKRPEDPGRDRFILSKGHGASALFATLALRGFFPIKELKRYRINKGRFHGHPCKGTAPGIEISTGSLGHGLSIGAGMALALKKTKPKVKIFVLLGDGECQEGSVWEAAMFSFTHNLKNLIVIVDANNFQAFGKTSKISTRPLSLIWKGFGWQVMHCDGHNEKSIAQSLFAARKASRPTVIIAKTISGKGIPSIENTLEAHYHVLDEKEYLKIKKIYEK